jgi:cellulose synthase (UDP-forming)
MPAMDAWGCAFCCGTSSVIRFEAIRSIGGLPTDSVTEDYLTTLRLKEKGYRTVYLNEPLSFGLAPEGLKEYVTQRGRWCLGLMQIIQGRSGPLSLTARIGLAYRIGLVHSFLSWSFVYLYKLAGIVVPSIYLMFGVKAIYATLLDLIAVFFPYFVIHSMTMGWISQGRILFVLTDLAQFLTAPAALKSVFSGIVKPRGRRFKVTAKGGDRRARFVEWPLFRIFFSLLVFAVAAVMVAFYWPGADPRPDAAALPLVWSWFNIFALSLLCLVCIEQPRRRASDRFPGQGDATVVVGGTRHLFRINDISAGGAQLEGAAPAPVGRVVLVIIGDDYLQAMIIRKNDKRFAVRFANTLETRVRAVRHVYSGLYRKAMGVIEPVPIVGAIARRIFR